MLAANVKDNTKVVELLVAKGADMEHKDKVSGSLLPRAYSPAAHAFLPSPPPVSPVFSPLNVP